MKVLLLVVVVASFTAPGGNCKGTAKGKFQYNNAQCKWHEERVGGNDRILSIKCGGNAGFSTEYKGNPHDCKHYEKDAKEYYECLNNALVRANFSENSPSEVSCKKWKCGDVEFKKVKRSLFRLIMKSVHVEKEVVETEKTDWRELEPTFDFN